MKLTIILAVSIFLITNFLVIGNVFAVSTTGKMVDKVDDLIGTGARRVEVAPPQPKKTPPSKSWVTQEIKNTKKQISPTILEPKKIITPSKTNTGVVGGGIRRGTNVPADVKKVPPKVTKLPPTKWKVPKKISDKLPFSWVSRPNKKGIGTRWQDPNNKGNGVRIDKGDPKHNFPSQQVDHAIVRKNGQVIGRDGKPILGSINKHAKQAHIPLTEYNSWNNWSSP